MRNPIPLPDNNIERLPMSKKIFTLCIFIISSCGIINAQDWSKEDSVWLKSVLEGKYDLKINEDTKKAIEDGRLIIPSWMKNDEGKINPIEIIKDFDDAGTPDSTRIHNIDPYSMPPAVYAIYVLYMDKMDSIFNSRSCIITDEERKMLEDLLPTGTVRSFSFQISNNYPGRIFGFGFTTDFNHLFSMAFSSLYRQKVHNRKHALVYKGYFETGDIKSMNMNERERKQLRNAMRDIKPSIGITSERNRNGIDN